MVAPSLVPVPEEKQRPDAIRIERKRIVHPKSRILSLKSFSLQHQILHHRENPGNQTFCGRFNEGGNLNWIESLNGPWGSPRTSSDKR